MRQAPKRRTLSPEARERIRQAQLKRWARVKATNEATKTGLGVTSRGTSGQRGVRATVGSRKVSRKKRRFSAETRERMRKAQLKRWAKVRAAK
jgi:hypothetical protein